jgi:hypothetical protein
MYVGDDLNDLDDLEELYIKELNTLHPDGYNMTSGGNKGRKLCEYTKNNISKSNRKSEESKKLPKYVYKLKKKYGGYYYSINKHPKCYSKAFETLEDCLEYLCKLDANILEQIPTKEELLEEKKVRISKNRKKVGSDLPMYVCRIVEKRRKSSLGKIRYIIKGHPKCKYKTFQTLEDCLEYLKTLDNSYNEDLTDIEDDSNVDNIE